MTDYPLPFQDLRVLDFGHTVMGPTAGLIFADLGAEVIRIEPAKGDPTRQLKGFGTGYFPFYNRNKQSFSVDLKTTEGLEICRKLIAQSDILIENFGPGTMERLKLGAQDLTKEFPKLIYLSLKGFLPGPYENRVALDEVVQMMSGLAYMTGPPGQPLRAGASVVDVMGGVFGVIGVLAALRERDKTGRGQQVKSALFESAMFLMGQHLAYAALSDDPVPPMTARVSAWAVYDQFRTADDELVFLGITSDRHWARFCQVFDQPKLGADESLRTNNQRIEARDTLISQITRLVNSLTLSQITSLATEAKLPFAHVARPEQLFEDPHLRAGERLLKTQLSSGPDAFLPSLPIELGGRKIKLKSDPPAAGADTGAILNMLGFQPNEVDTLFKTGIVNGKK